MAMDEKGLGAQLQSARVAAGLTQQALCHKANLSYSTLAKIERGAIRSPSIFTIQAIADALDLGLDALIGNSPALSRVNRVLKRSKNGVSFIYFDVNGCLIRFYERAFVRISADLDIPTDQIEAAFWRYNGDVCRGILSLQDFNETVAKRLQVATFNWQKYYLEEAEAITAMHDLVKWTATQYRVGLLTNIMPGLLSDLKRLGKVPDITYDSVIDSSEIGFVKPEAGIFKVATDRAGVPASEILLIDDTPGNLTAAEQAGWHVTWFDYARPEELVASIRKDLEPADGPNVQAS
ncbi:HAD-IA family hydrolase [Candidatus Saccharibacteria bacterium]|nr:HAD-IA family hydrolase [Candidatus Saccharibacteria bacterium]